jgi:hypothetical protein
MAKEYVEQRQGGYYLTGVRVSLDSRSTAELHIILPIAIKLTNISRPKRQTSIN